ncbi:MAG: hypothetical protein M0R17_01095 [Candidatus Omnitrophica bacterium]|jgi:hypothetical protein|nr:hypothetical protein [Candidatus Omnitrophota bacterium]
MKSIINDKSIAKVSEFPKLMKFKSDHYIVVVLMTGIKANQSSSDRVIGIGYVVATNNSNIHPIGEFEENWYMDNFADLDSNVTIELSNN